MNKKETAKEFYEANVRSQSALNKLRAGNGNAQGNMASTYQSAVRYGKLPDQASNAWLCVYRPSFAARIIKVAIGEAERATDGVVDTVFKIPKVLPLATLAIVVGVVSALITNLLWMIL